jgi:hypothetical protein
MPGTPAIPDTGEIHSQSIGDQGIPHEELQDNIPIYKPVFTPTETITVTDPCHPYMVTNVSWWEYTTGKMVSSSTRTSNKSNL